MAIKKKPSAKPSAAKKPAKQDTPPDPLLGKQAPRLPGAGPAAGGPYVLYFYPKDDTPGCTKEACDFRDGLSAFRKAGVRVIGVSPDSEASHARFSEKYSLPFELLSDPDKQLARAYSVWVKKKNYGREYMGIERSTFLIDAKGVVRRVWRGVKVAGHVDSVLAAAKEL